jgi:hypothetical protein
MYENRFPSLFQNQFQVLAALVINVDIFWDIAPCSPYVNRNIASHTIVVFV